MGPLVIAVAAVAVGGALWFYKQNQKYSPPGQVDGELPGVVHTLVKGKTYAVLATITKAVTDEQAWKQYPGVQREQMIGLLLSSAFTQGGFKVLSTPVVRNEEEMKKALAGEDSVWVFNAQWLMEQSRMGWNQPKYLRNITFVMLPI